MQRKFTTQILFLSCLFVSVSHLYSSPPIKPTRLDLLNDLKINEVLAKPLSDVNKDGTFDASQDEFIEIYNNGLLTLTIGSFKIEVDDVVRFSSGAINLDLLPGDRIVVFGGGNPDPSDFSCGVYTATDGLHLSDNSSKIELITPILSIEKVTDNFTYNSVIDDVSWARNPDGTGAFVRHNSIIRGARYSPCLLNDDPTLPVKWVSFDASAESNAVNLSWSTINDNNFDYFTIESSSDLSKWDAIARVDNSVTGSATDNGIQTYKYRDFPKQNKVYYRIRENSKGDLVSYSNIRRVEIQSINKTTFIYPNPVKDLIEVVTPDFITQKIIFNSNGDIINVDYTQSKNINVSQISSGLYYIKILTDKGSNVYKFLKL